MDYKKKYNKLVEAIKVLQETNPSDEGIQNWVNDNVPELKESEDKIPQKLHNLLCAEVTYEQFEKYNLTVDSALDWLEKQGERKETLCDKCRKKQPSHSCQDITELGRCALEKQDEQKPSNVQPKFGIGWWITSNDVHNDFRICKIVGVDVINKCYTIESIDEYKGYNSFETFDKLYHEWIIQDVKDGDVLVNGSNIFIFHFINDTRLMGYCHVNTDDGRFYDDIGKNECFCLIDAVVNPATKEQRDMLFQKMHEAGYTFDFEKKKLKKIKFRVGDEVITENEESLTITRIDEEGYWSNDLFICNFDDECIWDLVKQKPVEWKQENREELTEFENAMMHIGGSFFGENAGLDPNDTDTIKEQAKLLLELVPKPEWSEEDEKMFNSALWHIKNSCSNGGKNSGEFEVYNWLKSVRTRIKGE